MRMVHWVYIVECDDAYLYVGETKRLFRRFNEHVKGSGSVNTGEHTPRYLVGLYKVGDNWSFMKLQENIKNGEYDPYLLEDWGEDEGGNLQVENHFTEMLFYLREKTKNDNDSSFDFNDGLWQKVRGGKYTKWLGVNPVSEMNVEDIMDRPQCHCGYPCEVKISKDKKTIYFVCALKNAWGDLDMGCLKTGSTCDYYKICDDHIFVKTQYEVIQKKMKEDWVQYVPKSAYKIHPESCIKCNRTGYVPIFAFGCVRRLCQKCFSNKYDELKKEYSFTECLITN